MRLVPPGRAGFAAVSLILAAVLFPTSVWGQDGEIRQQIAKLADRDADTRREAIEALGQTRDERVVKVLQAFSQGNLVLWNKKVVLRGEEKSAGRGKTVAPLFDPLTSEPLLGDDKKPVEVDTDDVKELRRTGQDKQVLSNVIKFMQEFGSPDPDKRLQAVRRLGENADDATFLPALEQTAENDGDSRVRRTARESAALIRLTADVSGQTPEQRLAAIAALRGLHSLQGLKLLQQQVGDPAAAAALSPEQRAADEEAIRSIKRYHFWVGLGVNLTNGLSSGSVLILMALGLSIIYGQMGVINMAHGELMTLGAYATYEMQLLFMHKVPSEYFNWYFVAAFPVAFCVSALIGWLIELIVVRHLYGRVLETLLATWGVSLILVQAVRVRYGDNIGVSAPTWLRGGFEVVPYLTVGYARCFILVLCALCVLFLYLLMEFTRIGLKIRATVQGRETAESLGVKTRRIDGFTFALGAGLAGIAGYALTLIAGVTPDMGQNYIVDSFLVVVTGGVGKLAGSVWAGLGIGTINQFLEPRTFGEALLGAGVIAIVASWILLSIRAFRESKTWGWLTLLVPVPVPFVIKHWSQNNVLKLFAMYLVGIGAALLGHFRESIASGVLMQDVQTRWARVLILLAVVVFIQWRPAGLFPPKGRLADV